MSGFRLTALAGVLALAACRAPEPAFRADDPAVIASIDSIIEVAMEGARKADADQVTRMAEGPQEFTFLSGDIMLDGLAPTREAFRATYTGVERQEQVVDSKRVRLVAPDVALVTVVGEGKYTDKAGWTSEPVGIGLTIVFARTGGRWQAVHVHQSIAP